ncbi:hypothetical protein SDC9_177247 [bioreactor metagenome]|uniref:Uncharacterized protein n=1 Tax=bioreactor metagenome TaxID=1076179 RepID=A0A645H0F4_9ZZZZ
MQNSVRILRLSEAVLDVLPGVVPEHVGGQEVRGRGGLGHLDDVGSRIGKRLAVGLDDGGDGVDPFEDLIRFHYDPEDKILRGHKVAGQGERSGVARYDRVVLSVILRHQPCGLYDNGGPSAFYELLGVHEVGLVIFAAHRVEFERVLLEHGGAVLLSGIYPASEPLSLGRETECGPYGLESQYCGLTCAQFCHLLGVRVCFWPGDTEGVHLSGRRTLGEDGHRRPVHFLHSHGCEYSFSWSH